MKGLNGIVFAIGFGRITDIKFSPDEYPYIISTTEEGAEVTRVDVR